MDATDMDAREYEARGIQLSEKPHDRAGAERRARDFRTLAAMAEGRRILRWLVGRDRTRGIDPYHLGRRHVGEELEAMLKGVLPRELFLEIVYPSKEE